MSQITKPDATLQLLIVNMSKFSTPDATPFEIAQFTVARLQLLTFFNLVWYLHTILTLPVLYIVYIYIYITTSLHGSVPCAKRQSRFDRDAIQEFLVELVDSFTVISPASTKQQLVSSPNRFVTTADKAHVDNRKHPEDSFLLFERS